jgi:hypothetical protein
MNFGLVVLLGLLLTDAGPASIEGQVLIEPGKPAILKTQGKDVPLSSPDKEIAATFADSRISGRRMKLVGKFRNDGVFEIKEFFVVRPDSLYRLIYFCDT